MSEQNRTAPLAHGEPVRRVTERDRAFCYQCTHGGCGALAEWMPTSFDDGTWDGHAYCAEHGPEIEPTAAERWRAVPSDVRARVLAVVEWEMSAEAEAAVLSQGWTHNVTATREFEACADGWRALLALARDAEGT